MRWSLHLGRISGIKIIVHWTFWLLIAYVVFLETQRGSSSATVLLTVAFVLTVFLCVVLHELGHALTAKRYGIKTKRITLLPIGGLAGLEKMPEQPKRELLIAVAGPMVNIVIAAIIAPFINFQSIADNPQHLETMITPSNFHLYLFSVNLFLVLFNAIPAFPMDGGRILRALLSFKLPRVKATNIAARLGQFLAFGFFFLGLFYNPFLVLIGIFVFFGAYSENMMVQNLELLKGYEVKDAMMTQFAKLTPDNSIDDAIHKLLEGSDKNILVVENDQVKGIISRPVLMQSLKNSATDRPVSEIMDTNIESIPPDKPLSDLFARIQRRKSAYFPVIDNGHLLGVIDKENVGEFVMIRANLN